MADVRETLLAFARQKCVRFLLGLPELAPLASEVSLALVGSVATGFCDETSDVDIAVVCSGPGYEGLAGRAIWESGRPTELTLDGVRLHYFVIALVDLRRRLRDLDDRYLYEYSQAVVLHDPEGRLTHELSRLSPGDPQVRRQRLEGKLDLLLRRARALDGCLTRREDIFALASVTLEILGLSLKVVALLDGVSFDPRKRLFRTSLAGPLGKEHEWRIRRLLCEMATLAQVAGDADYERLSLAAQVSELASALSDEARRLGFAVGLPEPDRRQTRGS